MDYKDKIDPELRKTTRQMPFNSRIGIAGDSAGAKVEYNDTKGTFHGYDMALDTKIVRASVKKRLSILRKHF